MCNDTNSSDLVVICLSTYNGERYLKQLLNSLLDQDYPNLRVFIRDDGSTDSTQMIIDTYWSRNPEKISVFRHLDDNLGILGSFLYLISHVPDNCYLMFCDQDDVWFKRKVSIFMDRMHEIEVEKSIPTLVFGDMVVTDQDLNVVAQSYWEYQRIDLKAMSDWRRLLVSNVVTGCSSMLNFSSVERLRGAPALPMLHDHLAAVLVARDGVVARLNKVTMYYRQHGANAEGARAFGFRYLVSRLGFFMKVIMPRYRVICQAFGLTFTFAVYFKVESIWRRLARMR